MDELPVCGYCTAIPLRAYTRTWDAGGERHAAVSHAATVLVELEGITRADALWRLTDGWKRARARGLRVPPSPPAAERRR